MRPLEKAVITQLEKFQQALENAAYEMDPSLIANYAFEIAKTFNSFHTEHSVTKAENVEKKILRLQLCQATATAIANFMGLLGIQVPERM